MSTMSRQLIVGLENVGFWIKCFLVFRFLGFNVQRRPAKKITSYEITTHEEHPINHSPCYFVFYKL